jgi:hypothetical protein
VLCCLNSEFTNKINKITNKTNKTTNKMVFFAVLHVILLIFFINSLMLKQQSTQLPAMNAVSTHDNFYKRGLVSTECVDLVAPDGLVFFTDGSLYGNRASASVFSSILNVRESYALGFHPKYMLFWRARNILTEAA